MNCVRQICHADRVTVNCGKAKGLNLIYCAAGKLGFVLNESNGDLRRGDRYGSAASLHSDNGCRVSVVRYDPDGVGRRNKKRLFASKFANRIGYRICDNNFDAFRSRLLRSRRKNRNVRLRRRFRRCVPFPRCLASRSARRRKYHFVGYELARSRNSQFL